MYESEWGDPHELLGTNQPGHQKDYLKLMEEYVEDVRKMDKENDEQEKKEKLEKKNTSFFAKLLG